MKNSTLRKPFLKISKLVLGFIGIFLGFSNTIVAQYGIPVVHYAFKGKVLSKECGYELQNINIEIKSKVNNYPYNGYKTKTDSMGNFTFFLREVYEFNDIILKATDTDSTDNHGVYKPKTIELKLNSTDFKGDYWEKSYSNEIPIQMESKGIPPCHQETEESKQAPEPKEEKKNKKQKPNKPEVKSEKEKTAIPDQPEQTPKQNDVPPNSVKDQSIPKIPANLYPNPNQGSFTFETEFLYETKVNFLIYDESGKLVYTEKETIKAGKLSKNFDTKFLSPGTYFFITNFDSNKITKRFVVQ